MPTLNVEVGENGVVEISTCIAHGCVEYYEGEKWIKFRYNEEIKRDDNDVEVIKDFNLMKRQGYKEYVDKFIEGTVVRVDEGNLHDSIKEIYSVYKSFMDEYSKGRKYIGIKIKGLGFRGIYTTFHMRYEETEGKYELIIQLEANKDGEGISYHFNGKEVKDPYAEAAKEFRRAAGLLMLFAEYINKPPLEQSQAQEKA
jgi:hypothetical protein